MSGRDRREEDVEHGEVTDSEIVETPEAEVDAREAVEADVTVEEQPERGPDYDPYYDEPVPKGKGGSFVIRDGKRYRRRPE